MPPQPRGRACLTCQSIKIKCELGASGGGPPPCERCTRLNKSCVLAPPKRQKDRVAELENRVKELTALLELQRLEDAKAGDGQPTKSDTESDDISSGEVAVSSQKKRKLETSNYSSENPSSTGEPSPPRSTGDSYSKTGIAGRLDDIVDLGFQQRVLDVYISSYQPLLLVAPLPVGTQASHLRSTMPNTLHAIVYIASCGILSWDLQDRINVSLIEALTSKAIAQCEKSFDLLQALQLVCLYYRSPRNSTHIPLFQLVNIEGDMAIDMGFGGKQTPPSLSISGMAEGLLGGVKAARMWLVSFIITQTTALLKRKSNDQIWTTHHDHCLQAIESDPQDGGLLALAQQVRAAQLLESISEDMDLNTALVSPVVGTESCQHIMRLIQNRITQWWLQIPVELWSSSLTFTGFYMELLLYEAVLHTPTNKASFAAPFIVERLSTTDVPTPALTPHHFDALQSLMYACQNLIHTAMTFVGSELVSSPTLIYAPRIAHAAVTLLRIHIAVTVPENTYGKIISAEQLRTMAYLEKCLEIVNVVGKIDSEAVMSRIVKYAGELKKWLQQYETSRLAAAESGHPPLESQAVYANKHHDLESEFARLSSEAAAARGKGGDDVAFGECLDPDYAIDSFGLLELFSERDLNGPAACWT